MRALRSWWKASGSALCSPDTPVLTHLPFCGCCPAPKAWAWGLRELMGKKGRESGKVMEDSAACTHRHLACSWTQCTTVMAQRGPAREEKAEPAWGSFSVLNVEVRGEEPQARLLLCHHSPRGASGFFIFLTRRWRFRDVEQIVQGHTASEWPMLDLHSGFTLWLQCPGSWLLSCVGSCDSDSLEEAKVCLISLNRCLFQNTAGLQVWTKKNRIRAHC